MPRPRSRVNIHGYNLLVYDGDLNIAIEDNESDVGVCNFREFILTTNH